MPGSEKCATAGTAGRVDFSLYDKAVNVPVAGHVLQARAEHFEPDILGLKGPQWNVSVEKAPLIFQKYSVKTSDAKLSNTLNPGLLNPSDARCLAGTTHIKANKTAAYDRGEASVGGWNQSTVADSPAARQAKEDAKLQHSLAQTSRVTTKLVGGTGQYITPLQRQQDIIDRIRETKAKESAAAEALVERYGEEGAELMKDIMKMKPVRNPKGGRATKDDINGVHSLPDYEDEEREGQPKEAES